MKANEMAGNTRQNYRRRRTMARGKAVPIESKIEAKKAEVAKLQERLEKAQAELKALEDKADEAKKAELINLIDNSGKSYDEIKAFLESGE